MKRAWICFTRVPLPGRTKTRLLPLLTPEECAALHRAFLRDLSAVASGLDAALFVAHTPEAGWEQLRPLFPQAAGFFPQEGEGLGQRMANALERVLSLGYDACVLTGSDLPELTAAQLESGFRALERADTVLGPADDGGYYLVGLKRPCPALFERQSYGGSSVLESTLAAAAQAGLSTALALPCRDVDTPEELRALWARCRQSDSHTARCLAGIFQKETTP